jgi:predicted outer membrane protein
MTSTPTRCSPPLRLAIAAALALLVAAPLQASDLYTKEAKSTAASATKARVEKAESAMKDKLGKSVAADRAFLDKAIQGSEKEVAATLLARERAADAKVRELASNLQRDHLNLLSRLDETAVALGVREDRTYNVAGNTAAPSPAASGAGSDTAVASGNTGLPSSDPTASGGYDDDMTASGSATLGGATITAPGAAAPAASVATSESAALSTPGMTAAKQDPSVQALSREAGQPFDRKFLDALISSHEKSVAEFDRASKDMSLSAQSRSLAEQSLPTLRDHLEMARSLRASLATN